MTTLADFLDSGHVVSERDVLEVIKSKTVIICDEISACFYNMLDSWEAEDYEIVKTASRMNHGYCPEELSDHPFMEITITDEWGESRQVYVGEVNWSNSMIAECVSWNYGWNE